MIGRSTTLLLLLAVSVVVADESVVVFSTGTVQGNVKDTCREFLGIPFAEPPVGNLRFAPPQAVLPWSGVRSAMNFSAGCVQDCSLPVGTCPPVMSEDCLYLNVYTPRLSAIDEPLPVMVFFPGGRFEMGAAGMDFYWGDVISNMTDTIVVTTNYRLGVLGFMASTVLAGNYGIQDQILALHWVQNNIGAFGGDPARVTIFGQSAGGSSVSTHLTSPLSAGLFSQAILESCPWTLHFKTPAQAAKLASAVATTVGCTPDDLTCLRQQDPFVLTAAGTQNENQINISNIIEAFYPWTPIVDGTVLTDQPINLVLNGQAAKVPIMLGSTEDEARMFVWEVADFNLTDIEYDLLLVVIFGSNSGTLKALYPPNHYIWQNGDNRPVLANLSTDYLFICPARAAARAYSAAGLNVFSYHFSHVWSFNGWGANFSFCVGYACHGAELPFVFQSEQVTGTGFQFTAQEQALANTMTQFWGNFAHNGDPNIPARKKGMYYDERSSAVAWPQYSKSVDQIMDFATPNSITTGYHSSLCDTWDSIGYNG